MSNQPQNKNQQPQANQSKENPLKETANKQSQSQGKNEQPSSPNREQAKKPQ